eukprot:TRINITY_DN11979_c0_g1_i2.p2 TRINITY_DN11979_c0_g1~~TRINITY_DN11979_c0_g1_i2.p2  ORF type:complete len:120 (-),score=19.62 TRINITY_DN11979_c0_g1_i2:84-443(-)
MGSLQPFTAQSPGEFPSQLHKEHGRERKLSIPSAQINARRRYSRATPSTRSKSAGTIVGSPNGRSEDAFFEDILVAEDPSATTSTQSNSAGSHGADTSFQDVVVAEDAAVQTCDQKTSL